MLLIAANSKSPSQVNHVGNNEIIESERLQFNWPYVAFVLVIAFCFAAVAPVLVTLQIMRDAHAGRPWGGGWTPLTIALLYLAALSLVAYFGSRAYREFNTFLTPDALIQKGVFGTKLIRWAEIRQISRVQYGLHVHGEITKIVIAPSAYRFPEQVIRRVVELARANGAPL
jgi:hypothetical protein